MSSKQQQTTPSTTYVFLQAYTSLEEAQAHQMLLESKNINSNIAIGNPSKKAISRKTIFEQINLQIKPKDFQAAQKILNLDPKPTPDPLA